MFRATLIALLLLPLLGCATPTWRRHEALQNDRSLQVELERLAIHGEPVMAGYSHPAFLSRIEVAEVLGDISFLPHKGAAPQPTIPLAVKDDLARTIVKGLGQAEPSDRIRFSLSHASRALFLFPTSTTTRGVAFIDADGSLNVAFDVINMQLDFEQERWGNPTRRTLTRGRLVPPTTGELKIDDNGREKPLWVHAPVTLHTAKVSDRIEERLAAVEAVTSPRPTVEVPDPAAPSGAGQDPPGIPDRELLERLRFLEELYRDGKIDRASYEEIRRSLLFPDGGGES